MTAAPTPQSAAPADLPTHIQVNGNRWATSLALTAVDLLVITFSLAFSTALRKWAGGSFSFADYLALWPVLPLFVALFAGFGLYQELPLAPANELKRTAQATSLTFLGLAAITFLTRDAVSWSRLAYLIAFPITLMLVPLARATLRATCSGRSWWGTPVIILGAGKTAHHLVDRLQAFPWLGLRPVAAFDDNPSLHGHHVSHLPILGPLDQASTFAELHRIRTVVVAMPGANPDQLLRLWTELGPRFPHVIVLPALHGFASLWVEAKDIGGVLGLEVKQSLLLPGPRFIKRCLDLFIVVLLSPILLACTAFLGLLIKLDSRGPLFYGQKRLGRNGNTFKAWKFRSMNRDADAILAKHLASDPALQAEWDADHKLRNDPRITRVGHLLRKTSLDELPQLWNVFSGQMSLVGPRPIVDAEIEKYGIHFDLYKRVRPGLTGLWQVSGRNNTTYEARVAFDSYYVRNWSVWLDMFILFKTLRVVVRGEGAF